MSNPYWDGNKFIEEFGRDIAAENAALRVFVIDLKRTMKKLLADAPEVPAASGTNETR